jgi:hypothetical protein
MFFPPFLTFIKDNPIQKDSTELPNLFSQVNNFLLIYEKVKIHFDYSAWMPKLELKT